MAEAAPQPSRHQRRRRRTRAALVEAARAVFAERGVEGATIQEIAERADVAKGSFYNHFDSRAHVLAAVAEATLDRLGAALDGVLPERESDPARVVAHSLYATLRACVEDPLLGAFVLRSAGVPEAAEAALGARGRRDLESGMRSGRFRVADLELAITAMVGAAEGVLRRRLRGELGAEAESGFVALVLALLGVPEAEAAALAEEAARDHAAGRPR